MSVGERLGFLQMGRALAALAVVAHHAGQASDAFTPEKYGHWFKVGGFGVDFFFVLSGFLIFHVHRRDPRGIDSARNYVIKRLRRIYVPYLPIALLLIAAYTIFPSISQSNRDWSLFSSLTLLPSRLPPALSVAWTLVFEISFYVLFLGFFFTRYFWFLVVVWIVVVAALFGSGFSSEELPAPLNVILHPLILEFVAGMASALLFSRLSPSAWRYPLMIGLALTACFFLSEETHRVFLGLALSPIVLGIALADVHFRYRLPDIMLLLGSASYSIYLVHNPLQSIVARAARSVDSWTLTFSACCVAGIVIGVLYHFLFEVPALRLLSRRSKIVA